MRWLNDEADALSRVIKRCLKTGFWTTAWLEDGALSCSRNGWNGKVDSSLAGLKSDKGLLADVREMLSHDVDGFRTVHIDVSNRIRVYFDSDAIEGRRYEVEYTPNTRWPSSDPRRVAPYWCDIWMPPIEWPRARAGIVLGAGCLRGLRDGGSSTLLAVGRVSRVTVFCAAPEVLRVSRAPICQYESHKMAFRFK